MAKKRKAKNTKRFGVEFHSYVEIEIDESLLPDDDWRKQFYPFHTLKDVAEHLAYNVAANGLENLSRLDGFADRDDSLMKVVSHEWEQGDSYELDEDGNEVE